eukprot:5224229-Alexandrium_andersonii.AAC.1
MQRCHFARGAFGALGTCTNCSKHSELELRGPRKDLKIGPLSTRGVRSALLFVQIPNLPMKTEVHGVR